MHTPKEQNTERAVNINKLKQIGLILAIIIIGFLLYHNIDSENSEPNAVNFLEPETNSDSELASTIIVHIKGEIANPGVYSIGGDFRLKDAIDCAGGLTENADKDTLNLAMFLNDGDEIIIPAKDGTLIINSSDNSRGTLVSSSGNLSSKININTASVEQLSKLPGIGKSIAEQIVQYRTYIKFKSPEDLKNVPGIGSSKYDNIRDYIYVK